MYVKGLTMIVGPPGTGKTDVAVQVIANLYHTHQTEKILIVTHSNAALNDLFEKIMTVSFLSLIYISLSLSKYSLSMAVRVTERCCPPPPAATGHGRGRVTPGGRSRNRSGGRRGVQQAGQSQLESRPKNQVAISSIQTWRVTW